RVDAAHESFSNLLFHMVDESSVSIFLDGARMQSKKRSAFVCSWCSTLSFLFADSLLSLRRRRTARRRTREARPDEHTPISQSSRHRRSQTNERSGPR